MVPSIVSKSRLQQHVVTSGDQLETKNLMLTEPPSVVLQATSRGEVPNMGSTGSKGGSSSQGWQPSTGVLPSPAVHVTPPIQDMKHEQETQYILRLLYFTA